ncbi:MAG: extracellular solute-binding protein, partial [Anaerolineae bacterium]|nr:extracellular solute-binding protein [Anaerolineae bacterium]
GTYGLPAEVLPYLIFYDRNIFDATRVPYPQPGWTWDDLIAAASQLTETEGGTVSRYGFVDGYPASTVVAMAQQYGVPLWDDGVDPPQPLFDTPPVAEVVRRYVDLARVYQVMPEPEIGSNLLTSSLINEGRAAIWTGPAYERDRHAARTSLGLLPFPEDIAAANPVSLYGLFASAGTAHPEATWRWISYASANHKPLLPGALPGRRSVGEQLSWWRQLDEDTRTVYEYALDHPAADDPLARPLWSAVAAVFSDDAALEQALANAQEWALNMQADLAQAPPVAPRPVASVQPTPPAGQTVVRFAPAPGADHSIYRALATAFRDQEPGIWVEIVPSPGDLAELPRAADCFAARAQVAQGTQPELISLDPLLSADPDLDLADFYPQFLGPVQEGGELWALP